MSNQVYFVDLIPLRDLEKELVEEQQHQSSRKREAIPVISEEDFTVEQDIIDIIKSFEGNSPGENTRQRFSSSFPVSPSSVTNANQIKKLRMEDLEEMKTNRSPSVSPQHLIQFAPQNFNAYTRYVKSQSLYKIMKDVPYK